MYIENIYNIKCNLPVYILIMKERDKEIKNIEKGTAVKIQFFDFENWPLSMKKYNWRRKGYIWWPFVSVKIKTTY